MSAAPATGQTPHASGTAGHRLGLFAAFFAIYILWGTTFLGIRVAVLEMPPIFAAGARFFTAGAILFVFLCMRGQQRPTRMEWRNLFLIAVLMFVLEYAGLFWGERYIPSGISSVLAATIPVFTLIAEVAVVREQKWNAVIGVATVLGFAGVLVLMLPGNRVVVPFWPALAILGGSSGWALGSVLSRSLKLPGSRLMTSAGTMMLGGAVLFGVSGLCGELNPLPHLTTRGMIALAYLIVVGSLMAFPAYVWLLGQMPATRVASYAYVNPIVAVALGYFLAGEAITLRTMAGGALVLISVFLILRTRR